MSFLKVSFMMVAEVEGELLMTKFITRHLKDPYCVQKDVLGLSLAAIRTWLYPELRSIFINSSPPPVCQNGPQ